MIPQAEYLREDIVRLAISNQSGNLWLAATELGLSRGQLVDYIAKRPEFMREVTELRASMKELLKDTAEDILAAQMQTDTTLLMFFLRTQAKDRGYDTSKSSVSQNNVTVNVDARSLIAAMRSGVKTIDEEVVTEEGYILELPDFHANGAGSGGAGEVLP